MVLGDVVFDHPSPAGLDQELFDAVYGEILIGCQILPALLIEVRDERNFTEHEVQGRG